MKRDKQIKLIALALAVMLAVVCTVMILGIQVGFKQNDEGAKITAPVLTVGLVALLLVFKLFKKQSKTSFLLKHAEIKNKKLSPYFTIGITFFDYILYCGILSGLCGIVSGILNATYNTMRFETLLNWSYTMSRMAIVFAVYVLCFLILTIGNMVAYSQYDKPVKMEADDES